MKRLSAAGLMLLLGFCLVDARQDHQEEMAYWREFVAKLKQGEITEEDIRPHEFVSKESQMRVLRAFRSSAVWEEWEAEPEIIRYQNVINYIIPLKGTRGTRAIPYSFMLILEEGRWFYRHVETIFIRLDKLLPLPASSFPDISEEQKQWAREEIIWSERVRVFNLITRLKDRATAFGFFLDGAGYFLGAKTWVPFVPPRRALILYLCWEQANLRGSRVILERLTDEEAVVKLDPLPYRIFRAATHLREQIDFKDFRNLYESIWKNRAETAGWDLEISLRGQWIILHFALPGRDGK
jgi:hypothetical protein